MKKISFNEFDKLADSGEEFVLLDVRNVDEFEAGHMPGAINIPLHILPLRYAEVFPDTSAQIVVYCRVGGRSGQATSFLEEKGYTGALLLDGGYIGYLGR